MIKTFFQLRSSLNISTTEFASLYSWYSWPNVVLPVIGGYLIDSVFGVRRGTIIFSSFILAGQLLLSSAAGQNCYWLMKVARFMFGVGGESLNMALNTYTVTWFRDSELNMVFGFQLSISRVGSTVNFLVMEPLYRKISENFDEFSAFGWTLLVASSFTLMSVISSLLLAMLDRRREKFQQVRIVQSEQQLKFSDIKHFPVTFWLLCICTMSYYGSIFPFISLAQGYFQSEFSFDGQTANFIVGKMQRNSKEKQSLMHRLRRQLTDV